MHKNFELKKFDTIYEESEEGSLDNLSSRNNKDALFPKLKKQTSSAQDQSEQKIYQANNVNSSNMEDNENNIEHKMNPFKEML